MLAKDVMTPWVNSIDENDSVLLAAFKMKELEVGVLPVTRTSRIRGMVTDRDIVIRGVASGCDPKGQQVKDVATYGVIFCHELDDVQTVAHLMASNQVRRILVLNAEGVLAGIISLGDLAKFLDREQAGEVLQRVSEHPETELISDVQA